VLLRRDDHVRVSTRLIAMVIIPFLLGAFVILYCFPSHTARLFAWPIQPTMTSMMLASAYLGGAYFFVRVLWERHRNAINPISGLRGTAGALGSRDVVSKSQSSVWLASPSWVLPPWWPLLWAQQSLPQAWS
jgi:hypothetical protein